MSKQRNSGATQITEIDYLYRDGSNYKYFGSFCVSGIFEPNDVQEYLFDHEFFVPERLGIPALRPEVLNEDDHMLHAFEDFRVVESGDCLMTADELVNQFRAAKKEGWFHAEDVWLYPV